jgi:predicted Zn-dependent protease
MSALPGSSLAPDEVVETALAAARGDGCVVIVTDSHRVNLRWANSSLTTTGHSHERHTTVVAVHGRGTQSGAGSVTRPAHTREAVVALVAEAEDVARRSTPEQTARDLVPGAALAGFEQPPAVGDVAALGGLAPALGDVLDAARGDGTLLYGYAEHTVTTTYLGTSTGTRHRHVQPAGHMTMTAKPTDLSSSAWVGVAARDLTEVDPHALAAQLRRRLGWARTRLDLSPGRYPVILPPTSVADLMIDAYWEMTALAAHEGRTVYANPGHGTLVGRPLVDTRVTLRSDPSFPALACEDVLVASSSGPFASVFDNGLPLGPTRWVDHGVLSALVQTRYSAELTGLPATPFVGNLILDVDGGDGGVEDLVARCDDGILLTSLWYLRSVDPRRLLVTGLTRDGVYVVRGGEVVGVAGNFRFNESPVDLLGRVADAGATLPAFSREWGEYFPRTAMPALRIDDFHFSTASDAL